MKLKNLLAEAVLNGQTDVVLTAVGEAFDEVMERNRCNRKLSSETCEQRNKVFCNVAELVYKARNLARKAEFDEK